MKKKDIWEDFNFEKKSDNTAFSLLKDFNDGLIDKSNRELRLDIESIDSYIDTEPPRLAVLYILYVTAPRLGNFRRKILTVAEYNDIGRFPVDVFDHFNNIKTQNIEEKSFIDVVQEIINSNSVKNSIQSLYFQSIEHKKSQGFDLLKKNHAGVLLMNDETKRNYGVIRIENGSLIHYTGKGLKELFNPNFSAKEKAAAKKILKDYNEDELMSKGYVSITLLEDIQRVLT
jgi:hypothetical protein